jgi:hypothetical protein
MPSHTTILFGSLLLLQGLSASASTKTVQAFRTSGAVTIDGRLLEESWQREPVGGLVQKDPDEGKPSTQGTDVWISYDDEALYVGAHLHDSAPDSIVSRIGRRDADLDADWFYFAIDPYHDRRTGFFFGIYAGGSIVDGTLYNDSWDDNSWDGVWESAMAIGDQGWVVEMKIPYSQLRFSEEGPYIWGVNFGRNIERRNEESFYVMVPKNESGWVSRFAELVGVENIRPPQRIEVLPYVASSAEFRQHEAGDPFNDGSRYFADMGADMKLGIGSNLTVNATLNPDFGQVEVDPAVVNLTQFETFFEEKRPFFIEGADLFSAGFGGANNNWGFNFGTPDFFYSRRIGRSPQGSVQHEGFEDIPGNTSIIGAAKLTGKLNGDWSIGNLHAVTAREYGRVDSAGIRFEDVVEPLAYFGVLRTLREFGEGKHAIGLFGTATVRDLNQSYLQSDFNKSALSLGTDGWTTLDTDGIWVLNGWVAGSRVTGSPGRMVSVQESPLRYYQQPDVDYKMLDSNRTSLSGYGGRIALNKQKGNWYLNTAFGLMSPGFELNDLGYQFRADVLNGHIVTGYQWYEPDGLFRRKGFNVATFRSYDFGGRRVGEGYFLFANGQFENYWGFWIDIGFNPAYVDPRNTRGGPAMRTTNAYFSTAGFNSDSRHPVVADVWFGGGRSESGGYRFDLFPSLIWKPSPGVNLSFSPGFTRDITVAQWVDNVEDPSSSATYGSRYIFGRLDQKEVSASIRLDWTFSPKLSLQVYVQPLVSVGSYTDIKELKQPDTYTFNRYGENGSTISRSDGQYVIDPDGPAGPTEEFTIDDPDFNFKSLRGNVVFRWEYLPGSTLYLVWTQNRVNEENAGRFDLRKDVSTLISSPTDNVFLVKVSYWFNP